MMKNIEVEKYDEEYWNNIWHAHNYQNEDIK